MAFVRAKAAFAPAELARLEGEIHRQGRPSICQLAQHFYCESL